MASRNQEVSALCFSHEEADTRILFHAGNACECGAETVVINSQDTDVAVMTLSVSHEIPAYWYQTRITICRHTGTILGRTLDSSM